MTKKVFENYFDDRTLKSPLRDLVTCFKGRNLTASADGQGVTIINLSDVDEQGLVGYDNLRRVNQEVPEKHFLQAGDVLVATKGTVKKIAVFEEQGYPVIAHANLTVLRPSSQVKPYYLKIFLDSSLGRYLLDEADRGRAVLNISRKNLLDIYLPMIPLVKQDYLSQTYQQGLKDYQRKVARAESEWANRLQQIEKNLLG